MVQLVPSVLQVKGQDNTFDHLQANHSYRMSSEISLELMLNKEFNESLN